MRKSVLWGWITLSVIWVAVIGWATWQAIEDGSEPIRLTVVPPSVPPSVTILDGRRSAEWTPEDVEAMKPPPENRLFEIRHPLAKPYVIEAPDKAAAVQAFLRIAPPVDGRRIETLSEQELRQANDRYSAAALTLWACCWATMLPTILLLLIGCGNGLASVVRRWRQRHRSRRLLRALLDEVVMPGERHTAVVPIEGGG